MSVSEEFGLTVIVSPSFWVPAEKVARLATVIRFENRPPRRSGAACCRGGVRHRAVPGAPAGDASPLMEGLVG